MGLFSWLYNKGLIGTIARDVLKKYIGIKSGFPNEEDSNILTRLWNYWLTLNEEHIRLEDDYHKIQRLNIIKDNTILRAIGCHLSLTDLYFDILYIECDITNSKNPKLYNTAKKIYLKEAQKVGLDFE